MFQFKTFRELYYILLFCLTDDEQGDLFAVAPRDNATIEALNWGFQLDDPYSNMLEDNPRVDYNYANALREYTLHGGQNIEQILKLKSNVDRFVYDTNFPNQGVNYGERISQQLPRVMELLAKDNDTRRGVITILRPEDSFISHVQTSLEFPCCETIQLLIRGGKLHMIVNMRSQNVYTILPYDVYNFTSLQIMIAKKMRLEVGKYYHNMKSAHIYTNEISQVLNFLKQNQHGE